MAPDFGAAFVAPDLRAICLMRILIKLRGSYFYLYYALGVVSSTHTRKHHMPRKRKLDDVCSMVDPRTHIDVVISMGQNLMHHIARETAQITSVSAIAYESHTECTNKCDVHRVEILYSTRHLNPDKSPIVIVNAGAAWHSATQHTVRVSKTMASLCLQAVPNTFACKISGKLHVCTPEHCSAYKDGNCVTEDGYLVCPLTGITHEAIDTFDKGWRADLSSKYTPETYASNFESMGSQSINSTKLTLKLDKTVSLIKNTFRVALSLFPNGEINTYIKSHLNKSMAVATVDRLCKQIRQIRRASLAASSAACVPSGHNSTLLHISDLHQIFQSNTERPYITFITNECNVDNHTLSLVAKHYVLQYKILYNRLSASGDAKGFTPALPIFPSFVISMFYLCIDGLSDCSGTILQKDTLLSSLLPPVNEVIRMSRFDEFPTMQQNLLQRNKFRYMTKYMLLVKKALLCRKPPLVDFRVDCTDILRGTTLFKVNSTNPEEKAKFLL